VKNKQTHITQKVKIYSEMQEIQNHTYNSSTNTIYNTQDDTELYRRRPIPPSWCLILSGRLVVSLTIQQPA